MMKNKKGVMWPLVLTFIGLVLAILIILALWVKLNPGQEVNKQVCHQSVIYKATVNGLSEAELLALPLKCQTENLCVTSNLIFSGNCDEHYLGEEYRIVRVSGDKKKIEEEINALIAEKYRECWWMMGQGKVRVYSRGIKEFDNAFKKCNACTRIAFSQDVKDRLIEINGPLRDNPKESFIKGTVKYLVNNHIPESDTTSYWQYTTNSQSNYVYGYSEKNDLQTTLPKAIIFSEAGHGAFEEWTITVAVTAGGTLAAMYTGAAIGGAFGSVVPIVGTATGGLIGAGVGAVGSYFVGREAGKAWDKYQEYDEYVANINIVDDKVSDLKAAGCTSFTE